MTMISCRGHRLPSVTNNISRRTISFDSGKVKNWFRRSKKSENEEEEKDELLDPFSTAVEEFKPQDRWGHLSEDQIMEIQDKSRLPRKVKMEMSGTPHSGTRLTHLKHYKRENIRKYWATYGQASGLKPGVCWPNKSELEFKKKFEEQFYPSFNEMVQRKIKEKEMADAKMQKYRGDILTKLKQLPKMKAEFMKKYDQKAEEEKQELAKRERLIQEVREYLGYNVAPGDSRFQEALEKMEEENRAVAKASKKQEKQARILAQLAAMATEDIKKADAEIATEKKEKDT